MTLRPLAVAAALVLTASAALAATDARRAIPISVAADDSFSAAFGQTHETAGSFTDTFTFNADMLAGGRATVALVSWAPFAEKNIDFTSATLNGNDLTLSRGGAFDFATLAWTAFTGPLVLTVSGISGPGLPVGDMARGAAYWVSLGGQAVMSAPTAPVPEPGTYALMLAGLSAVGFLARRRTRR
jgi:hypothetical protein